MDISLFSQPIQFLINGPVNKVSMMVGIKTMKRPNINVLLLRLTLFVQSTTEVFCLSALPCLCLRA